jgi:hypothetical protein
MRANLALTALLTSTLFAMADNMPVLDVKPVCHGIAAQAENPTEKGGPDLTYNDCITSEDEVRKELGKKWSTFTAADQGHCVREATMGGESSYTELLTCLEMARDVRQLHSPSSNKRVD